MSKLSDRLLNRLVPAGDATACAVTCGKERCSGGLRTGRCERTCCYDCHGTQLGCDECVC
ncbi:hypothetical protein [Phytomonospora endophytica]|uniref:Metallothionein n=1 Tax=Phytomonospora endophytica TaxID=714109 RepID=A0A841F967_9ACTN|nr:hypothetical protein [Phytomonospora endophytica]MBB6033701.1 hypothetical protein [Phytomonospora endophytica]